MFRQRTIFALAAFASLVSTAHAAPGDHIRAGDAEIVPSVQAGAEYRTNLYRTETDPVGGGSLLVAPGVAVTAGSDDHSFQMGGQWELRKMLFVQENEATAGLSAGERASRFDRFNDFGVTAAASLFKREVVGFTISDAINMRNNTTDAQFSEAPFTTQFRNRLAAGLPIRPGPALAITPGALWTFDQYLVPRSDSFDSRVLNYRHSYGPNLNAKWAFLPRTSLFANASYTANSWTEGPVGEAVPDTVVNALDSQMIRTMAGIDGRFTERIFLNLGVGYGVGLYEDGISAAGLDGLLLSAQGRYQLVQGEGDQGGASWTLGYQKEFRDSFFTNYVSINRIYTGLGGKIRDFNPALRYELRFEDYDGSAQDRQDLVNRVTADVGYSVAEWAVITPGVYWQQRASSDDLVEYDDWNIHLFATFTY
jgi:hypothetical protein